MGVATASNAGEALSELERAVRQGRPYDLVLLEEDLPGMSGHDIVVRIRANPAFRGTRIIITANTAGGPAGEALFDGRLVRPVKPSVLMERIAGICPRSGNDPAAYPAGSSFRAERSEEHT